VRTEGLRGLENFVEIMKILLFVIIVALYITESSSFKAGSLKIILRKASINNSATGRAEDSEIIKKSSGNFDIERTKQAMQDARNNLINRSSPGAGLETADEQSDAAYADLINTSMDQRFIGIFLRFLTPT
jgi:hypothetical protein